MMHLDGFDLASDVRRREGDIVADLHDPRLDPTDRDGADTGDGIDVLDRQPQRELGRLDRYLEIVEALQKSGAFPPCHLGALLSDVLADEGGCGNELDGIVLVADHPQKLADLFFDLVEALLGVLRLGCVHLVHVDYDLVDAKGLCQEHVLLCLRHHTLGRGDHEDGRVGLGCSSDHVLDEITVSWGVYDREVIFVGGELLVGHIDGDTALPLLLEVVHDPGELEGTLALGLCLFLVLLDQIFLYVSGVEQYASHGCGFPVVHMPDEHQVHMWFFRCHLLYLLTRVFPLITTHIKSFTTIKPSNSPPWGALA